jgi:molecular chaperone HscA
MNSVWDFMTHILFAPKNIIKAAFIMAKIPIDLKEGKIKTQKQVIIGIDLGTTNSLVAYMNDGKPTVVGDTKGQNLLVPSIINFGQDHKILVGDHAKNQLMVSPERTIYSVKRLMGKSHNDLEEKDANFSYDIIETDDESLVKIKIDDKFYSPIDLSAEILKFLKQRVEQHLGHEVHQAVITVPAYFNDTQRQATKDAGKLAGLNVLRIINEPTAASLAYGIQTKENGIIAVYDLGGGTFDISILELTDGVFEVLSTNGDTFLGGDDFDKAIIDRWIQLHNISDDLISSNISLYQALRISAEEAKKHLSTNDHYKSNVGGLELNLTKKEFEVIIQDLVEKTIACTSAALKDAKKQKTDIDEIVLVGGSTKVPYVRKAVETYFDKKIGTEVEVNPDEVVALGAAIQADILAGNNKDLLLLDITPLSMGIETIGGLMDVIVPRNSTIPLSVGRNYTTSVDGQKNLKVAVFQGERDLVKDNRKLGEFILNDIPPMAAGIPKIAIHFVINADGILKVKAMEERSGVESSVQIKNQYGISEEEMGKMLLESIQKASEDMAERSILESINEANNVTLATDKFISQNKEILTSEDQKELMYLKNKVEAAINARDKNSILEAVEKLNEFSKPLAHIALENAIASALKGKKV